MIDKKVKKMNLSFIKEIWSDIKLCFLLTAIGVASAGFIEQKPFANGKVTKVLATSSEASTLQCLHRCKFIDKNAKAQFANGICKCVEVDEEKIGTVPHVLTAKKIELKIVAPPKPVNVALGKPSSQISTFDSTSRFKNEPRSANDGNLETCSITGHSYHPWWRIDLQKLVEIKLIRLHFSVYAIKMRSYSNLQVWTKKTLNEKWSVCKYIGNQDLQLLNVTCDTKNVKARYVKVDAYRDSKFLLYLHEVEIYTW